ncbi:MAG TPA: 3-dehydroquinate synthase [Stellaceae bacterium]|nr:3-dehydroquinate synthase [Stellaceae bacterium]
MSPPEILKVSLGNRSYDIVIGEGLLNDAGRYLKSVIRGRRVVVVSDTNVAPLHLKPLLAGLEAGGLAHHTIILPPGEQTKDLAHFGRLSEEVLALGIERTTPLIALGGGVIGDLTGFAAACLLRGLDFVQVPTSLLAQVDSSVGGKTGIDSRHGKNLIGAFHQPVLVLADIATLATLPEREVRAGYAEIVKYGLIRDTAFYEWLERHGQALLSGDPAIRRAAVLRACAAKASVVAADEREAGERALLNFGHTFGHALEAETGFSGMLLHGEAVALGICLAFDFSVMLGLCPMPEAARVKAHLRSLGLPTALQDVQPFSPDSLIAHMRKDKKVRDGRITLILARAIGDAFVSSDVPEGRLREFLVAKSRGAD